MNFILVAQILALFTFFKINNDLGKQLLLAIISMFAGIILLYPSLLGNEISFNIITLVFLGALSVSLILKRKENLFLIALTSLSMYPSHLNHWFFLESFIFITLFAQKSTDLKLSEKINLILGLLIWPSFLIINNFSFSFEIKFLCACLFSFFIIKKAYQIKLNAIALYALILSQIMFLKFFEYSPDFGLEFILILLAMIIFALMSKKNYQFLFTLLWIISIVFCGLKIIPLLTSYYLIQAITPRINNRTSKDLVLCDIFRLLVISVIMLLGLMCIQNTFIAVLFILMMTVGSFENFFKTLGHRMNSSELILYPMLLIMNILMVSYA